MTRTIGIEDSLAAELARIIRSAAKIPDHVAITSASRLVEDLGIDSLDFVGVILRIQDHFDIAIEEDAVPHLRRVEDLVECLRSRLDRR